VERFHASAPQLEPVSVVGAGDVLTAAFLATRLAGRPFADSLRYAVAAASASTLEVGAGRFDPREAGRLSSQVEVGELEPVER
jgi:fructose-1-phosphate kinase PfkB-like protein